MPLKSPPGSGSHGTAIISEHSQSATADPISPPVGNTLKNETRDVETVLEACLALCVPEQQKEDRSRDLLRRCLVAVLPICNGESRNGVEIRSHLTEYAAVTPDGRDRYKPFVLAFNRALADLRVVECDPLRPPSDLAVMFHRNNITAKDGKGSGRPDVILAALDTVRAASSERSRFAHWDHFAYTTAGDPPKCHFDQEGVLSGQEFRLSRTQRSALRNHYDVDNLLLCIDPQPIPGSVEGLDADGADTTEEVVESGQRTSPKSARDSGKPKVLSSQRSARPAAAVNSTRQQQFHGSLQSAVGAGGGGPGKRKWEAERQVPSKKRFCESDEFVPAMLQSASDAAERMSRAFWVTHVINLIIVDDVAYVWYCDNEYSVQSLGINFIHDLPYFLVLLLAFQRFTSRDWGVMEEFRTVNLKSTVGTSSNEEISFCVGASPDLPALQFNLLLNEEHRFGDGPMELRMKMLATTSSSRDPRDITKTLEGVDMVSKLHWSQESQVHNATTLNEASEAGEGNEGVGGHLPDPIYTHDFDQHSTTRIRTLLGIGAEENGRRVLRLAVFRRLHPITDLVGMEFWRVFWECFHHHLDQWLDGMRDHDISISDLKYDMVANRGIFDPHPSGTEQTGTMPFMALDLLSGAICNRAVKREYHHEVESFAWILLWICCTYEDGKELRKRPLQDFIQPNAEAAHMHKVTFYTKDREPTSSYSKQFYRVALVILAIYNTQHIKAAFGMTEPSGSESSLDKRLAINMELEICRQELASAHLPVDFLPVNVSMETM